MKTRVRGARPIFVGFLAGLVFSGAALGLRSVLADGIPAKNPLYYAGTLTESGQPAWCSRAASSPWVASQAARSSR
jgi:hypothetical protein